MKLLTLIFLVLPLLAQTTITGTFVAGTGDRVSGTCDIQAVSPFTSPGGFRVVGPKVTVAFSEGAFSVSLLPTDTAAPASYYTVACSSPPQTVSGRKVLPFTWPPMKWLVPTSAAVLDISAVITGQPPAPGLLILLTQIPPGSTGTFCLTSTNGVIAWLACTGGSGGAQSWATLSSSSWAALTSSTWSSLIL